MFLAYSLSDNPQSSSLYMLLFLPLSEPANYARYRIFDLVIRPTGYVRCIADVTGINPETLVKANAGWAVKEL